MAFKSLVVSFLIAWVINVVMNGELTFQFYENEIKLNES